MNDMSQTTTTALGVHSEVGQLRKVLVCAPGHAHHPAHAAHLCRTGYLVRRKSYVARIEEHCAGACDHAASLTHVDFDYF